MHGFLIKSNFTYCIFLFWAWKVQNDETQNGVFIEIKVNLECIFKKIKYWKIVNTHDQKSGYLCLQNCHTWQLKSWTDSTFCALWILLFRQKQHSNPRIPMAFFSHELTQYVFSVCLFVMKILFCLCNVWSTDIGHRSFYQNNK